MNANPAQTELDQLAKLKARADKIASDAARWPASLEKARTDLASAEKAFLVALDTKAAATLAEAAAAVRYLEPACNALARVGGPRALGHASLYSPELFAAFASGFEKRRAALEKLKPAARAVFARATAAAVAAGKDPRELVGLNMTPAMRDANELLRRVDDATQEALVAFNFASSPANREPRSFDELLGLLSAPLPVIPAA